VRGREQQRSKVPYYVISLMPWALSCGVATR
jgi:hypothetical protein